MTEVCRLADLCTIDITDGTHQTPTYVEQGIKFLSSKNVTTGVIDWDNIMYIPESLHKELYKRIAPQRDDILLAKNGTTGVAAIVDRDEVFDIYVSLALLRPNQQIVNPRYLLYAINNPSTKRFFDSHLKGIGVPNLHLTHVRETPIPVPSMEKQHEIVDILDKLSDLIAMRKKQLQKLDDLVKSRFVELFGDPVTNPKGWDMPLIEDVVANEKNALKAGPFGSALKKEYYVSSGYKIYGQEQVISGDHTFGDYYIDEDRYKSLENCAVQAGDVLISLVGTYGKLLVMPEKFEPGIINPRLMKITFDKKRVNPYYFQHYFQSDSLKKALAENTHGGTMDILNLGIVRKLAMPLPPLKLQNEFIAFVEQTDKSKLTIQQSLDKLELMKKALMQKYFG